MISERIFVEGDCEKESISLFPNPVRQDMTISLQDLEGEEVEIVVFDVAGKYFETIRIRPDKRNYEHLVSLEKYSAGHYIFRIQYKNVKEHRLVMKITN